MTGAGKEKTMESRCMGWGFRVDREGNLHDAFPAPADREAGRWPRTPWRVKVRHPRKHRAKRLLKGTFNAAATLSAAVDVGMERATPTMPFE